MRRNMAGRRIWRRSGIHGISVWLLSITGVSITTSMLIVGLFSVLFSMPAQFAGAFPGTGTALGVIGNVPLRYPMPIQEAACEIDGIRFPVFYRSYQVDYDRERVLCNKLLEDVPPMVDLTEKIAADLNDIVR